MDLRFVDKRPLLVALAGPNGAGKSTFYAAYLKNAALRLVNADLLAKELNIDPYVAAAVADAVRRELLRQRESFVFETVFSDPAGDKLNFLREAVSAGYSVVLCFIGLSSALISEQRVAMRVTQGGHDVPTDKLLSRFPRTLANLKAAARELPCVIIFDNDDLREPFKRAALFQHGKLLFLNKPAPKWISDLFPNYL